MIVDSVWRIGNTNDLRQRLPPRSPRPPDVICQTWTLAAPEAGKGKPMLFRVHRRDASLFLTVTV